MKLSNVYKGTEFICNYHRYRVTDVGTRTVVAIDVGGQTVTVAEPGQPPQVKFLQPDILEAQGWFKGPPYALHEIVFDENDLPECTIVREQKEKPPSDDQLRQKIRTALAYNDKARIMGSCTHLYMGSQAASRLMGIFGLNYGQNDLKEAIDTAKTDVLLKAVEYCRPYWEAADRDGGRNAE